LCHGPTAEGVARLGKPLRNIAYVQQHTDEELKHLIASGRLPSDPENTTGAVMPARGGRGIGDERLSQVVTYLRALQDPSRPTVSIDDWIIATSSESGGATVAGLVGSTAGVGHDLFVASCSACHGPSGQGMEGLGKPLNSSPFVESKTDEELMSFVKAGRPIWDAENTTGLDMPSKGGNPALTDAQLSDIVKDIRSLHE
jgi:disulfide bond formation protein DsbB